MRVIKIFIILFIVIFLKADLLHDYLNAKYNKVCKFKNIEKYKKDENLLSLIGMSCLKTDKLYVLPYILVHLKHLKNSRKNALYFLTILMQKRLLYSYLFDGQSLQSFSFPLTDYVLSYIFEAIKNNNYTKDGDIIIIKNKSITYKVYKQKDKMFIDEYENKNLIKRRWYR